MAATTEKLQTMEEHPSFRPLLELSQKYPTQTAALFQAFHDLTLSQGWAEVTPVDVPDAGYAIIRGRKSHKDAAQRIVVPIQLSDSLSLAWFRNIFTHITPSPQAIFLAIAGTDSSIVYYRLASGIVKPDDLRDD